VDEGYVWIPGAGMDPSALARLRDRFRRPVAPMREAWFMGEHRRHFPELMGSLQTLEANDLLRPLGEIASGTVSFGHRQEWRTWFHYLLAQLACDDREWAGETLTEGLVTGFMAHYPDGVVDAPYVEFRQDVLATLGRTLMQPQRWRNGDIVVGRVLHRSNDNPQQTWGWWTAHGELSAALLLCLKYLPPAHVRAWFRSVLAIESPHWRAQIVVWLIGAHDLLTGVKGSPSELDPAAYPSIDWSWSHCLRPVDVSERPGSGSANDWLPRNARAQALEEVRVHFTDDVWLSWLESIGRVDDLQRELADLPSTFECLYLR